MPSDLALEIAGVSVDIEGAPYVRDISVAVPRGQIHGLLGPNGAGKTTLLRCLYRAAQVDAGRISAFGRRIEDHSPQEWARTVGALVQSSGLLAGLTPVDIVEIGLAALGLDKAEAQARLSEALALAGLADKARQPASLLSGGELQRCYFAQLLACDPPVYVLDEPSNHLDLHYQLVLLDEVRRRGRSVLMTMHDLSLAMRYCEEVSLMSAGRIVANGPPQEVLSRETLMRYYHVDAQFHGTALSLIAPILGDRT